MVIGYLRNITFAALLLGSFLLIATACQNAAATDSAARPSIEPVPTSTSTATALPTKQKVRAASQPPPTLTLFPTSTPSSQSSPTSTPSPTTTPTPIGKCAERLPANGLTSLVTSEYGIAREYVPPDLVSLSSYLPLTVTLGYPTQIREIAAGPLAEMISAMHAAGLRPTVNSGYRSYAAQSIAWSKWQTEYPERAAIISALPGHSEHQLGTTVDFGSPELPALVGDQDVEYHTNFYMTGEGQWLAEHAYEYGFILSYPRETFELTGMYYEPWHYRYVEPDLAATLNQEGLSLINYLLDKQPPPCIP